MSHSAAVAVVRAVEDVPLLGVGAGAAHDLEVLQAEGGAVAHPEDRVLGQRLGRLVELQVEPRAQRGHVTGGSVALG